MIELPKSVEIWEGQRLTLTCGAQGRPMPTIEWIFNGKPVREQPPTVDGRSHLAITEIRPFHTGAYVCVARNPLGVTRSMADVKVVPRPQAFAVGLPTDTEVCAC